MKSLETIIKHCDYPLSLYGGWAVQLKEIAKVIAKNRMKPKKKPYRFPALSSPFVTHQASDNTSVAPSGTSLRLKLLFIFIILGNAVFIPVANASRDGNVVCRMDGDDYAVCATEVVNIVAGEVVKLNGYGYVNNIYKPTQNIYKKYEDFWKGKVKWFRWEQLSGPGVEILNEVNAGEEDVNDSFDSGESVYTSAQYIAPDVGHDGAVLLFRLTMRIARKEEMATSYNVRIDFNHNVVFNRSDPVITVQ